MIKFFKKHLLGSADSVDTLSQKIDLLNENISRLLIQNEKLLRNQTENYSSSFNTNSGKSKSEYRFFL